MRLAGLSRRARPPVRSPARVKPAPTPELHARAGYHWARPACLLAALAPSRGLLRAPPQPQQLPEPRALPPAPL
eukprot:5071042-Prymnesium_polylepis.1